MTKSEIEQVEEIMNEWISEGIERTTEVMDTEEAQKTGAMALFGEKYGDKVRVVSVGNVSKELCGGTHVNNTSEIRLAKIVSESAISAGSRRIEAVCSDAAFKYLNEKAEEIDRLAHRFKSKPSEVEERVEKLVDENKALNKKIEELQQLAAKARYSTIASKSQVVNGGKFVISKIEDFEPAMIKTAADMLSDSLKECIIVLVSVKKDGLFAMVKVSDNFVQKGINAGKIVGEITSACGGKGGGRPNFAQGAAKDPSKLDTILAKVEADIKNQLK